MPSESPYSNLVPEGLIDSVISAESGGDPTAVSPVGAQGIMQIMPPTAQEIAGELGYDSYDIYDPELNKKFGTHYLGKMIDKFGDESLALAAYNAGPGRVGKELEKAEAKGLPRTFESIRDSLPEETRNYVAKINGNYPSRTDTEPVFEQFDEGEEVDTFARYKDLALKKAITDSQYSENMTQTQMDKVLDPGLAVKGAFNNLYKKTPEQRAEVGGVFGASAGLSVGGLIGSVVGAGVGAIAARSAGEMQTEGFQVAQYSNNFIDVMSTWGLINRNGAVSIDLDNGDEKSLVNVSEEIPNTNPIIGEPYRNVFEKDPTNPFTARAENYAVPLAMFVAASNLSQPKKKNAATKAYENVTNFFINALVAEASSMSEVESNLQGVMKKLGLKNSDIRNFLKQSKGNYTTERYKRYLDLYRD